MFILDFLFYYLTYWFEKNKDKLSWSSPASRASYAIGLATVALIYSIDQALLDKKLIPPAYEISKWIFLVIGLGLMALFDYVYDTGNRSQLLSSRQSKLFSLDKDTGAYISIAIVGILILSPFIVTTIFVPFGSGK
jgi:hypothetical protein